MEKAIADAREGALRAQGIVGTTEDTLSARPCTPTAPNVLYAILTRIQTELSMITKKISTRDLFSAARMGMVGIYSNEELDGRES